MKRFSPNLSAIRMLWTVSLLMSGAALLGACNTTAGVGKDVSATGNAVTNTADKVKQGL
jgi:predicted small secreted protein